MLAICDGVSSVGKTSVCLAALELLGSPWVLHGFDSFVDAHRITDVDFHSLISEVDGAWHLTPSCGYARAQRAFFAAATSLIDCGYHVLVEHVFLSPDAVALLCASEKHALPVVQFRLVCSARILDERESHRADRPRGLAAAQSAIMPVAGDQALIIDVSSRTINDVARELVRVVRGQHPTEDACCSRI